MKTLILKTPIGFSTDDFLEVNNVILTLDQKEIDQIKLVASLVKNHNLTSASIPALNYELFQDEKASDFRDDGAELLIFRDTMYISFQHKHNAASQYESNPIELTDLVIPK